MRILTFIILSLFTLSSSLTAQIYNPVKWDTDFKHLSGQDFHLIFTATIDDGWSIYSQYLENDDGPVRTSFEFDAGDHYQLVGKNEENKKNRKEGFDDLFGMNVIKYYKKAVFTQKVKVTDPSKPIVGYLEFMTCDDTKCLPPDMVDFSIQVTASNKSGAVETPSQPTVEDIATKVEETKTETEVSEKVAEKAKAVVTETAKIVEVPKKAIEQVKEKTKKVVTEKKEEASTIATTPAPETKVEEAPTYELNDTDVTAAVGAGDNGLLNPVKWSSRIKKISETDYDVIYTANIDKGWYIYSQFLDGDGPEPTAFEFEKDANYELVGKTKEEGPKRVKEFDKFFDMDLIKYKELATFTQRIKVKDPSKAIKGLFVYMTCEAGRCLPPEFIDFWLEPSTATALIGSAAMEKAQGGNGLAKASASMGGGAKSTWKIENGAVDQKIDRITKTYVQPLGDCGKEDNAKGENLFWTFILGFGGGLLALLTPCVFPMIPLTVSYFTKGSKDRATGIKNGLIYGLSIILIYVTIGLLITAFFGADALNALSTNWIANTMFFLIFVVFALSFFGYFEITLPSSWANKSDAMADKGGLIGTFFMAFTLSIVSFSCTGPIIGSAIVQSATSALGPFTVMLGFSTALALPFGLFAAFPAWLNSLPSSGSWMTSVKVVLGFLELALALKFLSVADMTMHWGILGYEIFMGLWVLIFGAMTLYLFGYIRFPHDSLLKKLSPLRGGLAVGSLALTLYLASGFMFNEKTNTYNSLGLMSGLAPPARYNYFLAETQPNDIIKEKYKSFTKCANDLDCFKDYYEGLAYSKEVNKPILLDFTGYGCVNCRKTEEHIWVEDVVLSKIKNDFVLISLYVDDREKLPEAVISKHTQKKLRNIGQKWADFQIVNFEQNSQPLYVMMNPNEEVLAKPRGYQEGVDSYAEFLECGLKTFDGLKPTGMK